MHNLFRDPGIPDGEKSRYSVGISGLPSSFEMSSVVTHEAGCYRTILDAGVGRDLQLTIEQRFGRADGFLRAHDYRAETRSRGTVVSSEEVHFVDTVHLPIGGPPTPFPPDIMPIAAGLTLLRGLEFAEDTVRSIDVWLAFSVHWPLIAKVVEPAEIQVGAGAFDCWQVRLRPSFAQVNSLLDKVIGGLLPPITAYFECAPPHRLVSSSFPTALAISAPRAVMELAG
ncbi:MAG: hypothetical protein J2P18_14510 [Nocardia sp.]|nr:hypothetical protein [Nocardia sp.]